MRRAVAAAVVCALVVAATGCGGPSGSVRRQQAKAALVGKVVLAEARAIEGQLHPLKVLGYDPTVDAFVVATASGQTAWIDADCLLASIRATADPQPTRGPVAPIARQELKGHRDE
jgi:hypothetical protein